MITLATLLDEHPGIVNILLGPVTVHYREVLLYMASLHWNWSQCGSLF